ncbi:kinase-like domain-containing protein [Gigaspora rosea]|uniref:Kinase-like domain-containing protein n=1 Tax=Gigaspora rosea TaxID=44941 RepID=A0A397VWX3_9GLOM|nr:kinase-like domain-containing protein [Gigaspora rosea]
MANSSHFLNECFEKAVSEKCVNYFDYNEFSEFEEIAEGAFGIIRKSEWKDSLKVAVKSLKINTHTDENTVNDFIKELKLLRKIWFHPNINTFYGVIKDPFNGYCMVLEFANNGNLRQYLKINFSNLNWKSKLRMTKEIASGLSFLHNHNIIHRDLHSKNILVSEGKMKIGDFGLSTSLNSNSCKNSKAHCSNYGMPAYVEPQYFKNPNYEFTQKSDIYSLGVILWEISSGKPPYQSFNSVDCIAVHVFQGKRETPIEGTPQAYVNLYTKCWDEDPHKRPDAELVFKTLDLFLTSEMS